MKAMSPTSSAVVTLRAGIRSSFTTTPFWSFESAIPIIHTSSGGSREPDLRREAGALAGLRAVAPSEALLEHAVRERVGEVAERDEERDQEDRGEDLLQERLALIEQDHRHHQHRSEEQASPGRASPRRGLDLPAPTRASPGRCLSAASLAGLRVALPVLFCA